MSHATNKIVEDIAELSIFSTAVYRQPALKVLIINESDADTVLFRSTLETISGEVFDLVTAGDFKSGLGFIGSGRFDIAFFGEKIGLEHGIDLISDAGGRLCPTPMVLLASKIDSSR